MKKQQQPPRDDVLTAGVVFERARIVVISFFSSFILDLITPQGYIEEVTIISIEALAMLFFICRGTRYAFDNVLITVKYNSIWYNTLLDILDFTLLVGIFLTSQLILRAASDSWGSISRYTLTQIAVTINIVLLTVFAFYRTYKPLTEEK